MTFVSTLTTGSEPGRAARVMGLTHCLLVVRHGRTVWNDQDRMCTRTDVALSDKGVQQAEDLGRTLAIASFDYAWSSPLGRARETARIVLGSGSRLNVAVDDRLLEPDGGPFEGHAFGNLETGETAAAFAAYMDEENPVMPEGAVSPEDAAAIAGTFIDDVAVRPGRHIAFSHGALIRILACEFLGTPPAYYRRLRLDNCHAALWKFWPQPPHQFAGWNL